MGHIGIPGNNDKELVSESLRLGQEINMSRMENIKVPVANTRVNKSPGLG